MPPDSFDTIGSSIVSSDHHFQPHLPMRSFLMFLIVLTSNPCFCLKFNPWKQCFVNQNLSGIVRDRHRRKRRRVQHWTLMLTSYHLLAVHTGDSLFLAALPSATNRGCFSTSSPSLAVVDPGHGSVGTCWHPRLSAPEPSAYLFFP